MLGLDLIHVVRDLISVTLDMVIVVVLMKMWILHKGRVNTVYLIEVLMDMGCLYLTLTMLDLIIVGKDMLMVCKTSRI